MQGFRAALGHGPTWSGACSACLEQLGDLPIAASLGFIYVGGSLAHTLDLVIARLSDATGLRHWVGSSGLGVGASGSQQFHQGAIAVLTTDLPAGSYRLFDGLGESVTAPNRPSARPSSIPGYHFAVVHGDPQQPANVAEIARLRDRSGAFLVGGLTAMSNGGMQVAGQPTEGGLSGVLFADQVPIVCGLSQGCTPIGPAHRITACDGPWIMTLDDEPALDVLKSEIGELLSRDLDQLSGFIHAARPVTDTKSRDYLVRDLAKIDRWRRTIAIGDDVRTGDSLMFVKRDPIGARIDLDRMLRDVKQRTAGRKILGGLYHSCVARGQQLFGRSSSEFARIEQQLGNVPIVGSCTNGEIFHDRLYGYAGVLTLFLR